MHVVLFCTPVVNGSVGHGCCPGLQGLKSDLLQCKVLLKKTVLNSIGLSERGVGAKMNTDQLKISLSGDCQ